MLKRINYISTSTIPSKSANSVHVMKMCNALASLNYDVKLFGYSSEDKYSVDRIKSYYSVDNDFNLALTNKKNLFNAFFYVLFIFLNFGKSVDLILSRHFIATILMTLVGRNSILEIHDDGIINSKIKRLLLSMILKFRCFKGVILITNSLKMEFSKFFELTKFIVLPDGADEINIQPPVNVTKNLNLCYVGSLNRGKGLELLSKLSQIMTKHEIHIIGGSDIQVKNWKCQFNDKITKFYGFLPQKDIRKLVETMDVFLLPNQEKVFGVATGKNAKGIRDIGKYTSPLKMFEYMSMKRPIIASDLPVLREILNEDIAILVDHHDERKWLIAIEELLSVNLRQELADSAYLEFINKYTWEKRAKIITNYFII